MVDNTLTTTITFVCPKCKTETTQTLQLDGTIDNNTQITAMLPCCNTQVSLYLASHPDTQTPMIRLSTCFIPSNWWESEINDRDIQ